MPRDRYDVSGYDEAEVEPGSRRRVLKNLLGVTSKREMDRIEADAQAFALLVFTVNYNRNHKFWADDIRLMHRAWLEEIYPWAGKYRSVNIAKEGFRFATAQHIPQLMLELEQKHLRRYTPCVFESLEEVAHAIATVHVELLLIHPFRDGNGRLARMLAAIMALQAGYPLLEFGAIRGRKREEYFAAVRAGLDQKYEPMQRIVTDVIRRTLKKYEKGP